MNDIHTENGLEWPFFSFHILFKYAISQWWSKHSDAVLKWGNKFKYHGVEIYFILMCTYSK